jgi:hypothetical protein
MGNRVNMEVEVALVFMETALLSKTPIARDQLM